MNDIDFELLKHKVGMALCQGDDSLVAGICKAMTLEIFIREIIRDELAKASHGALPGPSIK